MQRPRRSRTPLSPRELPVQPGDPLSRYRKVPSCNRIRLHALVGTFSALRRPRRPAHHPGNPSVPDQTRFQTRRLRCPTCPWRPGARNASHLRHRTRWLRRQRLHVDEAARSRVYDHLAALRHRGRHRNPECCSTESSVRSDTARRRESKPRDLSAPGSANAERMHLSSHPWTL